MLFLAVLAVMHAQVNGQLLLPFNVGAVWLPVLAGIDGCDCSVQLHDMSSMLLVLDFVVYIFEP